MAVDSEYSFNGMIGSKEQLEDGEIVFRFKHWRLVNRVLMPWLGKELEVLIKIFRHNRSNSQNKYMWGVIIPTIQAWQLQTSGKYDIKDGVYAWLRTSIIGDEIKTEMIMGREVIYMTGKRFSKMNTKEFSESVEKIIDHFAEKGCHIPLPKGNNNITDFVNLNDR